MSIDAIWYVIIPLGIVVMALLIAVTELYGRTRTISGSWRAPSPIYGSGFRRRSGSGSRREPD